MVCVLEPEIVMEHDAPDIRSWGAMSGKPLDPRLVRKGREEEIEYFKSQWGVHQSSVRGVLACHGSRPDRYVVGRSQQGSG